MVRNIYPNTSASVLAVLHFTPSGNQLVSFLFFSLRELHVVGESIFKELALHFKFDICFDKVLY